jgi:putative transposase
VRRYHRHYGGSGHVWQGRFKAFPIQQDEHLLTVLRYVERNALRAGLAQRAEEWPWGSLAERGRRVPDSFLHPGPVPRGREWLSWVNRAQTEAEVRAVRHCIVRGTPFGEERWVKRTVVRLGLESTIRSRGRPRKSVGK